MTEWVELKPGQGGGRPGAPPARFEIMKGWKLSTARLTLSRELSVAWPKGARCRIMCAPGQLMLTRADDGPFTLATANVGRCCVSMPLWGDLPLYRTSALPCEVEETAGGALIVTLPAEMPPWVRRLAPRQAKPASPPAGPAPAQPLPKALVAPTPEPVQAMAGKIDVIEYLTRKGHAGVRKIAGGRIEIDGDAYGSQAVLNMVNRHRVKAGLDTVDLGSLA